MNEQQAKSAAKLKELKDSIKEKQTALKEIEKRCKTIEKAIEKLARKRKNSLLGLVPEKDDDSDSDTVPKAGVSDLIESDSQQS